MVEAIKEWVINISVLIILIAAIQLILPNNSLKKYAKFVLGLLVVLAMINPILKIINSTYSMEEYSIKTEEYFKNNAYKKDLEYYKKVNEEKTLQAFRNNLEKKCKNKLKNYYKNNEFKVEINVAIDKKENNFIIENVKIGMENKGVKKVNPIIIGEREETVVKNIDDKEKEENIKKIIEEEIGLGKDYIKIYQLD